MNREVSTRQHSELLLELLLLQYHIHFRLELAPKDLLFFVRVTRQVISERLKDENDLFLGSFHFSDLSL